MFEKSIKEFILQEAPAPVIPHCMPVWKAKEKYGLDSVCKLASNENPLGVSPKALEAIHRAAPLGYLYSDNSRETLLSGKIAKRHGVTPANVFISGGAAMVLKSVSEVFIQPGDEVIIPSPAYPPYFFWAFKYGGTILDIPCLKEEQILNVPGILAAVSEKTKLIFLCNPNNPTGTAISRGEMAELIRNLPGNVIVVADEAYVDFADDPEGLTMAPYLAEFPNLVVVRSFSKIYGMAAIRLGYALACEEIIGYLDKAVDARGINMFAVEGGIAALDDEEFRQKTIENNRIERAYLTDAISKLGYTVYKSQSNFLWVDFGRSAADVHDDLLPYGIIIRGDFPFTRISVGTHPENKALVDALIKIKAKG